MIDPRIAQRQIELEKRKKQQQNNLKQGQNKNSASYYSPTPAASAAPKNGTTANGRTSKTTQTSYGSKTVSTTPSYSTQQTVNKTFANSGNVSASAKGSVSNALQKANSIADSVYKPNSAIGSNEYTTTAQRQAQQKSLQEQKARENYIYKMNAKKNQKEYGGYSSNSYNGTSVSQTKTFGDYSTPKAVNSVYSAKPAQIKNTGSNAEMTTVKPKKESTFQKVENQTVDLIGGKRKSMFDWLDDWSNLGGGPNKEIAETAKIKGKEKADLTAAAQGEKPYKPQDVFVSKDSVRIVEPLTERQQLQADLLKLYGEKGRRGVDERHSLYPDANVYDNSDIQQQLIALEQQLDALDKAEGVGLYDNDLSFTDRVGNTFKEWRNRGLYTTDYIAQTAGTALTDFFESQLNEEYNSLINRRMDLAAQLNRITFGYDEDPYGKRYAALEKEMEQLNRYIDENYREKMDTTTDAYRAMERAQRHEDKAVEGMNPFWKSAYNVGKGLAGAAITLPLNMYVPGATLAIETADNAVRKMHEINSSGGTAGQALGNGVTAAGIMFATKKAPIKELAKFSNSNIGRLALKEELVKHGLKMSQNVLEYAANYMADLSYHNPNAQFTLSELAGEIAEDYLKEIILDY